MAFYLKEQRRREKQSRKPAAFDKTEKVELEKSDNFPFSIYVLYKCLLLKE